MKIKQIFICEKCGYSAGKWLGKCPQCEEWNTFREDYIKTGPGIKSHKRHTPAPQPVQLDQLNVIHERTKTLISEFDNVAGGGIVAGSLLLLSGEPGIGKSTLTLSLCDKIASQNKKILYVSGEESPSQIGQRAVRMNIHSQNIQLLGENNLESILNAIETEKPQLTIIDSIQVIHSDEIPAIAGSISQVRHCAEQLMARAKKSNLPILLIGHVNKEGNLAGPKILEHLVDAVLLIEGDRYQDLRILRSLKNRFGSTNEIGLFTMTEEGLKEIKNASALFLEGRKTESPGSSITVTSEGTRSLLIEVQALTNSTPFGYPKRAAEGFDVNRLQLLIAVMQKHLNININEQDVYINIAGGYRLKDPSADLAVISALLSTINQKHLPKTAVFLGEIGLCGELRNITGLQKRITECEKIGYTDIYIPESKTIPKTKTAKLHTYKDIRQFAKDLFS